MVQLRSVVNLMFKFLFVSLGIVFISALIGLFTDGIRIELSQYISNVWKILTSLSNPEEIMITNRNNNTYRMFPFFWKYYIYSSIVFMGALNLAIIVAFLFAFFTIQLPQRVSKVLLKVLSLLESIPDILIIIIIQFFVIITYRQTGILLAPVAGAFEPVYLLPIVSLSILPSIFIFRIILLHVIDEQTKPYVDLARSKGFNKIYILSIHIIRNISPSLMNHMKPIILILLSNLIVFERLFNIYGITHFILSFPQIEVICLSLILFYVPIFIFFMIVNSLIVMKTGQKVTN